jgi:hypothetical protein
VRARTGRAGAPQVWRPKCLHQPLGAESKLTNTQRFGGVPPSVRVESDRACSEGTTEVHSGRAHVYSPYATRTRGLAPQFCRDAPSLRQGESQGMYAGPPTSAMSDPADLELPAELRQTAKHPTYLPSSHLIDVQAEERRGDHT